MAAAARRGRPKTPREHTSDEDRRHAARIEQRRMAMRPVKTQLAKMGQTQKWLVRQLYIRAHLGISQQTISNYLNGHAGIAEDMLIWICAITGVDVQQILAGDADRALLLQTAKRPLRYQRHTKAAEPVHHTADHTADKNGAALLTQSDSQATS